MLRADIAMGSTKLIREGLKLLRDRGVRETAAEAQAFFREAGIRQYHQLTGKADRGAPIYEQEWDVLVILDACRVDYMRGVAPDYGFIDTVNEFESLGSYSLSWMEQNFTEEYADEMANTVHVTGNPFSETALNANDFALLDEVWRYSWDDDIGTIHPRPITDRAITHAREHNPDRLIIHYMQPHAPFTQNPNLQSNGPSPDDWMSSTDKSIWMRVREGEVALEDAQAAYRDELRYVLDDVELLLANIDAETAVITADHGESMGELGIYGHARGIASDSLRVVPWVTTSATDTGSYNPETYETTVSANPDTTSRLRDLGYLD